MESHDDLPAIWIYSPMMDRLRRTPQGWKIIERYIGGSATNQRLNPKNTHLEHLAPFMPVLKPL